MGANIGYPSRWEWFVGSVKEDRSAGIAGNGKEGAPPVAGPPERVSRHGQNAKLWALRHTSGS